MTFKVGDLVEVIGYPGMAQWNGEEFEIREISGEIAKDCVGFQYRGRPSGFAGAMYLKYIRHVSRPDEFIQDI